MMQHPAIAVYPAPDSLRRDLPLWAFGLEGSWLSRHQAGKLAALAAGQPKFSGIAARLAAWNFERAPP